MNAKTMNYAVGLASALFATASFAQGNYALGPVESSTSKNEVVVLGQRFALDGSTRCTVRMQVVSKSACSAALLLGSYVAVEGDSSAQDKAAAIVVLPYSYVPGASTVMVGGKVSATRHEYGLVSVGSLRVDENALFASGPISVARGQYVEYSGIQPVAGGIVLADGLRFSIASITGTGFKTLASVEIVSGVSTQSITGTGIRTFTGSGVQFVTGTGIQSITGTGAQSITGTGAQSITGTGAQSITGTGAQSITGTGAQSITGTGAQSITGTGAQSITGTGAQSITGTGAQSITGTGIQSITGTGAQSITGTGVQSITVTGAN